MTEQPDRQNGDGLLLSEHEFTNELGNRIYVALRESEDDDLVTIIIQTIRAKSDSSSENTVTKREALELAKVVLKGLGRASPQPTRDAAEGADFPIGEDTPYWRALRAALSLPVEDQHKIATDLAANCGYELTGDAYTAPPKPAPDAMREALTSIEALSVCVGVVDPNQHANMLSNIARISRAARLSAPVPPADGAGVPDDVLPCDVHLPPNTFLRKGCRTAAEIEFARKAAKAAAPPVRGDQEAIARIIDQEAFEGLGREPETGSDHEFVQICDRNKNIALAKADAILSLPVPPGASEREAIIAKASALARRLCQLFDSGGESQRTVRARHASAIFQLLGSHEAEQSRCDADPVCYLERCERLALSRQAPPSNSEGGR